jgi:hypothetical protein
MPTMMAGIARQEGEARNMPASHISKLEFNRFMAGSEEGDAAVAPCLL